jgi:hypothetical protein
MKVWPTADMNMGASHPSRFVSRALLWGLMLLVAASCSSDPFRPPKYSSLGDGLPIENARSVVICQPFVRVTKEERDTYDKRFHPSDYLKSMLVAELSERGVPFTQVDFGAVRDEAELAGALAKDGSVPAGSVVMTACLVWFPDVSRTVCDVTVFSDKGDLLFFKRGICVSHDLSWTGRGGGSKPFDASEVDDDPLLESLRDSYLRASRMAMKQVFDDPALRRILRKDA